MFSTVLESSTSIGPFSDNENLVFGSSVSSNEYGLETFNSDENRLQEFISHIIGSVGEVERIFCQREEHAYFVWIIIKELDRSVRRKIYAKQKQVISLFGEENFDFYVVASLDKPMDAIINQVGLELIYNKTDQQIFFHRP